MRRLVNYLRQMLCQHDWGIHEGYHNTTDSRDHVIAVRGYAYMRCKKCGYHQMHWTNPTH